MKRSTINEHSSKGTKMFVYPVQNGEIVTYPGTKADPKYRPRHTPFISISVARWAAAQELLRNRSMVKQQEERR